MYDGRGRYSIFVSLFLFPSISSFVFDFSLPFFFCGFLQSYIPTWICGTLLQTLIMQIHMCPFFDLYYLANFIRDILFSLIIHGPIHSAVVFPVCAYLRSFFCIFSRVFVTRNPSDAFVLLLRTSNHIFSTAVFAPQTSQRMHMIRCTPSFRDGPCNSNLSENKLTIHNSCEHLRLEDLLVRHLIVHDVPVQYNEIGFLVRDQ